MKSSLALGVLLSGAATVLGQTQGCNYDSGSGATYNLNNFASNGGYSVYDGLKDPNGPQHVIQFSLCGDLNPVDQNVPQCNITTGDDGSTIVGNGNVFRTCVSNCLIGAPKCRRHGSNTADTVNTFLIINNWNPASGLQLWFGAGDFTSTPFQMPPLTANAPGAIVNNRAMIVYMSCVDVANSTVDIPEVIPGATGGLINVLLRSYQACPNECPRSAVGFKQRICGGNGVCDYDVANSKARCFCNQGWSGDNCLTGGDAGLPPAPSFVPNIAGGFIGGLLAGIILVAIAILVIAKKTNSSFVDAVNFGSCGGGGGAKKGAAATDDVAGFYGQAAAAPTFAGAAASVYEPPTGEIPQPSSMYDGPLL